MASQQFEPLSGARDFLAGVLCTREHVFAQIREMFERLETLTGKYGDEGDKLILRSCAAESMRPPAKPTWPCGTT